jgi:hypothetical protein
VSAAVAVDIEPRIRLMPVAPPKPPPPPPETLQGIGNGIREILVKVDGLGVKHERLADAVGRVEYKQNEQGYEIKAIKREQQEMKEALDDHGTRIVELERLPRARPPHPSEPRIDDLDEDERTSPGGRYVVAASKWAQMERALSYLREQVDGAEQARLVEQARAQGAEEEREAIRAKAEADRIELATRNAEAVASWDHRLKRAKLVGGIVTGLLAAALTIVKLFHL